MTETQQRFLRAIAERVPMDQVVELHLFPPIRQGGVETGVAVVAEDPRRPMPNVEPVAGVEAAGADSTVNAPTVEAPTVDAIETNAGDVHAVAGDAVDPGDADDSGAAERSPYADDPEDHPADLVAESAADPVDSGTNGHAPVVPRVRLTIHTARYRLTLKGVDRGKWEVDVVAEADAPLDAIDAVIRGVQRRAGEGSEPDRLNAEAFRGALEAPLATLER